MMKLVQINSVCNGSTGKIMCGIADEAEKNGFLVYNFYGRGNSNNLKRDIRISNQFSIYLHVLLARFGLNGHGNYFSTKILIKKLKIINPDIIHLHNIHGYYINLRVLFNYLKKDYKGKVIWTLHDCWSFTGHCSHFDYIKCDKWKTKCKKCPQKKEYPKLLFGSVQREYKFKKNLFSNIKNLTIVTPSNWLAKLVKKSYLNKYKIEVVNNGINIDIFKKRFINNNDIYSKYNISNDKKIILGIASVWSEKKGLEDFNKLSKLLSDEYRIVLVGINSKLKKKLSSNIISIDRTDNQDELAKIYSISYVLFNPTYEDTYPTVNLESISCGLPVITYNTGGSPETLNNYGFVIEQGNINEFLNKLNNIKNISKQFNNVNSNSDMINNYLKIYKEDVNEN